MKFNFAKLGIAAAAVALLPLAAVAATQSVTANISFDTPLSLTKNADVSFGTVSAGVADSYTITTAGAVSAAGTGQLLFGSPVAGNITVAGSAGQAINISAGSYTANNGVTPSAATCSYNGGAAGSCALTAQAAPATGKTLLLGVTAAVDGTQAAGSSAAPTFVVTVVYN